MKKKEMILGAVVLRDDGFSDLVHSTRLCSYVLFTFTC